MPMCADICVFTRNQIYSKKKTICPQQILVAWVNLFVNNVLEDSSKLQSDISKNLCSFLNLPRAAFVSTYCASTDHFISLNLTCIL
ncbi:hypothetical protein XELAEV_18005915mg [Xenopus laevis]|uniref:Uncharacterized protein n=1 Tax=Xenopus laevis TaxID=8355 RepID=A0A974I3B1_XENLA|nr:hypothetical protein XELAEV_18005915mg [Xenopus laevis]